MFLTVRSMDNPVQTVAARRWLWAITLVALATRIVYALLATQIDPFLRVNPLHGDAASYNSIARNLLHGYGFASSPGHPTAFWPPLYPMFLAGLYDFCGYNLLWARLAQAVFGAIAVAATARAAYLLLDRRVALLTALGMAFYPHLIYFGAWLIAEALYMALLALSLWIAACLQKSARNSGFALLGALLGLGALAKPAALLLIPLVALWTWIAPPTRPWRDRLMQCLLVLLIATATVMPWTVRNYLVFHALVPISTNGGYTFYGANNPHAFGGHREGFPPALPGLSEPQAEQEYYRLGMDWIKQHPRDFAKVALRKLERLFSPLSVASFEKDYRLPLASLVKGIYTIFLLAALAGALLLLQRWREVAVLYALVIRVLLGAVIFYGDVRYTLPMLPSFIIFASFIIVFLCERLHARQTAFAQKLASDPGEVKE